VSTNPDSVAASALSHTHERRATTQSGYLMLLVLVLLFIADFYNQRVRAVGPDGVMRDLTQEGRVAFGAPTRVVYAPRRGWLYVADSSDNRIVPLPIPKELVGGRPALGLPNPMRRTGG